MDSTKTKPGFEQMVARQKIDVFDIHTERHVLLNGERFDFTVIHVPHFVVVIPRVGHSRFLLIRQYRPSWRRLAVEFPAGGAEGFVEPPEDTARRELVEETGYWPTTLTHICSFQHSARSNQVCHGFLADGLEERGTNMDPAEVGMIDEVLYLTQEEVEEAIISGEMVDVSHVAVWERLRRSGLL